MGNAATMSVQPTDLGAPSSMRPLSAPSLTAAGGPVTSTVSASAVGPNGGPNNGPTPLEALDADMPVSPSTSRKDDLKPALDADAAVRLDLAACLAPAPSTVTLLHAVASLTSGLVQTGVVPSVVGPLTPDAVPNDHLSRTWHRLSVLHWVHADVRRKRTAQLRALAARTAAAAALDAGGAPHTSAPPALPYDADFGVQAFVSMLQCLDAGSSSAERAAFIREVGPTLQQLPMLSLYSDQPADSAANVLDMLRDHLFISSSPTPIHAVQSVNAWSTNPVGLAFGDCFADSPHTWLAHRHNTRARRRRSAPPRKATPLSSPLSISDRTRAVEALLALAQARGSLGDFLLAVQALVGAHVGHASPLPPSSSAASIATSVTITSQAQASPAVSLTTGPDATLANRRASVTKRAPTPSKHPLAPSTPDRMPDKLLMRKGKHAVKVVAGRAGGPSDDDLLLPPDEEDAPLIDFPSGVDATMIHNKSVASSAPTVADTRVKVLLATAGPAGPDSPHRSDSESPLLLSAANPKVGNAPSANGAVNPLHRSGSSNSVKATMWREAAPPLISTAKTDTPAPNPPPGPAAVLVEAPFLPLRVRPLLAALGAAAPEPADWRQQVEVVDPPQVWTCGQNVYGELGVGGDASRAAPTCISGLNGKGVVAVAAGNEHTIVLTFDGHVYSVGYNDNGQCGHAAGRVPLLRRIMGLADKHIVSVHAYNGCEHTLVVTDAGELYAFGYNAQGQLGLGHTNSEAVPRLVRGLAGHRVTLVSCSYYHSVVATDTGSIFTFGLNEFGQLGHGDTVARRVPTRIEHFTMGDQLVPASTLPPVVSLSCGQYHTMFVLQDGSLYAAGQNDFGQLGTDSHVPHTVPTHVTLGLANRCVRQVCSGYFHSIVLCTSGAVLSFGRNDYGQLGLGHAQHKVFGAQDIPSLADKHIVHIAAGCYHTITVASDGLLYVFGRNNHGQLGLESGSELFVPSVVDAFRGKRVAAVAAGFYHSVVLTGSVAAPAPDCLASQSPMPVVCVPAGLSDQLDAVLATLPMDHRAVTLSDDTLPPVFRQFEATAVPPPAAIVRSASYVSDTSDGSPSGSSDSSSSGSDDDIRAAEGSESDRDDAVANVVGLALDAVAGRHRNRRRQRLEHQQYVALVQQRSTLFTAILRHAPNPADNLALPAALRIMAKLGQLAEQNLPPSDTVVPLNVGRAASVGSAGFGQTRPLIVDLSPYSLTSLASFMCWLMQDATSTNPVAPTEAAGDCCMSGASAFSFESDDLPAPSSSDAPFSADHHSIESLYRAAHAARPALLSVCLQLVQVNIAHLLRSDQAFAAWTAMQRALSPGMLPLQYCASGLARACSTLLGWTIAPFDADKPTPDALPNSEADAQAAALRSLHVVLLRLVLSPPAHASALVAAATRALMLGLPLFYPTPAAQVQLLCTLLSAPHRPAPPTCACVDCRLCTARCHLLRPLLRRMCDDSLLFRMLPGVVGTAVDLPVHAPPHADMFVALVDRVSHDTQEMLLRVLEDTSNGRSSAGAAGAWALLAPWQAHIAPYVGLVSCVQQHLLSWVASSLDPDTRWLDLAARSGLVQAASMLLGRCDALVRMLLPAPALPSATLLACLDVLAASFFDSVLPAMIHTLMMCACVQPVATAILDGVTQLLVSLDRVAAVTSASAGAAPCDLDGLVTVDNPSVDSSATSCCVQADLPWHVELAKSVALLAGRAVASLCAERVSQCAQVTMSAALSASDADDALAQHMHHATGATLSVMPPLWTAASSSHMDGWAPSVYSWLASSLFRQGLCPEALASVSTLLAKWPGAVSLPLTAAATNSPAVFGPSGASSSCGWAKPVLVPALRRRLVLLPLLQHGTPAADLASQLRARLSKQDMAYRMCLREGRKAFVSPVVLKPGYTFGAAPAGLYASESDMLDTVERAAFVAIVAHLQLDVQVAAIVMAAAGPNVKIPVALVSVWRLVATIRQRLVAYRRASADASDQGPSMQTLCQQVLDRAVLLLDIAPAPASSIVEEWRRVGPVPHARSKRLWRIMLLTMLAARQWSSVKRQNNRVLESVQAALGTSSSDFDVATATPVAQLLHFLSAPESALPPMPQIRAAMLLITHGATCRVQGLSTAALLCRILKTRDVLCDMLQWVAPAVQSAAGGGHVSTLCVGQTTLVVLPGNYLAGLAGAHSGSVAQLVGVFGDLLSRVVDRFVECTNVLKATFLARAGMQRGAPATPDMLTRTCIMPALRLFGVGCELLSSQMNDADLRLPQLASVLSNVSAFVVVCDAIMATTQSTHLRYLSVHGAVGFRARGRPSFSVVPDVSPVGGARWRAPRWFVQLVRCRAAAWSLLRLAGVRFALWRSLAPVDRLAAADNTLLQSLLSGTAALTEPATVQPCAEEPVDDAPGHAAWQVLIAAPRTFLNMEQGCMWPAGALVEHVPTPAGSSADFSLTFWLLLEQPPTSRARVIALRGSSPAQQCPLIVLRPCDTRIEVMFMTHYRTTITLTSKLSLTLGSWTHVAVVSEGSRVRLFMNGTLEAQRSTGAPCLLDWQPLYIGRLPPAIESTFEGIRGGIEGSVAQFRYYARALSPIQVRAVCELEPCITTRHMAQREHMQFQLATLLYQLCLCDAGTAMLASPQWLSRMLSLLVTGPATGSLIICRALARVLPRAGVAAAIAAFDALPSSVARSSAPVADPASHCSIVSFLVQMAAEHLCTLGARDAATDIPDTLHATVRSSGGRTSSAQHPDAAAVAAELLTTLRSLCDANPEWRATVLEEAKNRLGVVLDSNVVHATSCRMLLAARLATTVEEREDERLCQLQLLSRAVAAVQMLGGQPDSVRVGATVTLPKSGTATVVAVDAVNNYVHVVPHASGTSSVSTQNLTSRVVAAAARRCQPAAGAANAAGGEPVDDDAAPVTSASVSRVFADDVRPLPLPAVQLAGAASDGLGVVLSAAFLDAFHHVPGIAIPDNSSNRMVTCLQHGSCLASVMVAQYRSRLTRLVTRYCSDACGGQVISPAIADTLFVLAGLMVNTSAFVTLDALEDRVAAVRSRVLRVVAATPSVAGIVCATGAACNSTASQESVAARGRGETAWSPTGDDSLLLPYPEHADIAATCGWLMQQMSQEDASRPLRSINDVSDLSVSLDDTPVVSLAEQVYEEDLFDERAVGLAAGRGRCVEQELTMSNAGVTWARDCPDPLLAVGLGDCAQEAAGSCALGIAHLVAQMEPSELAKQDLLTCAHALENMYTVVLARQAFVSLLLNSLIPGTTAPGLDLRSMLGSSASAGRLVRVLRLCLFRGRQFAALDHLAQARDAAWLPYGEVSAAVADALETGLWKQEAGKWVESVPGASARLCEALVEASLDDFERGCKPEYSDELWGRRMLRLSDAAVMLHPNVEFGQWALRLVNRLATAASVRSQGRLTVVNFAPAFARLLRSASCVNPCLKEAVFEATAGILSRWVQHPEAVPDSRLLTLGKMRFDAIVRARMRDERLQGRLYFSPLLTWAVQCTVHLSKLVASTSAPLSITVEDQSPCSLQLSWPCVDSAVEVQLALVLGDDAISSPSESRAWRVIYTGTAPRTSVYNLESDCTYVARMRRAGCEEWSSMTVCRTLACGSFVWNDLTSGPNVGLSADGLSASFMASQAWSLVVGKVGFTMGVNRWSIRIERSSTPFLFVGVSSKWASTSTFLGGDEHGWGYIGDRALYHHRSKVKSYGERFGAGDIIGVTLDMDAGTLSFSKNGVDLGVAFTHLTGELFPAVALYSRGQVVSLLPEGFSCPGANVGVEGSPARVSTTDVVTAANAVEAAALDMPIPSELLNSAWDSFCGWRSHATWRARTVAGYDLNFDTTDACRRRFGAGPGDRVRTARGNSTVIGSHDGRLWVRVDGDAGAWFVTGTAADVVEGLLGTIEGGTDTASATAPGVTVLSKFAWSSYADPIQALEAAVSGQTADGSEEKNEALLPLQDAKDADDSPLAVAISRVNNLSRDEFVQAAQVWNKGLDASLMSRVNEFCDKRDLCPWNVSPRRLLQQVMGTAGLESLDQQVGAVIRFGLLRAFNEWVARVVPLIDLRRVFGGSNATQLLPWPEGAAPTHTCATLVQYVADCRSVIFLYTKKRVLQAALDRTVTRPKKADDEYDYPEDLPQLVLNRPSAAAARESKEPLNRITGSLLGQARDALRRLEPSVLRMGYAHPMDDGQQRAFKVKFDGEGVDDYGGPYREAFAQFAQELQATTDNASGFGYHAVSNDDGPSMIDCVLPLFMPCANRRNGCGGNRDRFVLRPSAAGSLSPEVEDMYRFVGQMFGMALRSRVHPHLALSPMLWKPLVAEALSFGDLEESDESGAATLKNLYNMWAAHARNPSNERYLSELEEALAQSTWSTFTSDGTEVPVLPGGAQRKVQVSDVPAYCRAAFSTRVREADAALTQLREGFSSVVPASVLPLLCWDELELLVCGRSEVDVDLLQQNTEYDEDISPNDTHIVSFWNVVRGFTTEQRQQLLRFVWARSRLPASAAAFTQKFKVQAAVSESVGTGENGAPIANPDSFLPKAHTCFFSISLPKYSTEVVMKERLLYAIYNCLEMDADFRLADSETGTWGVTNTSV